MDVYNSIIFKNLLMLSNTKLHSKSWFYQYKQAIMVR